MDSCPERSSDASLVQGALGPAGGCDDKVRGGRGGVREEYGSLRSERRELQLQTHMLPGGLQHQDKGALLSVVSCEVVVVVGSQALRYSRLRKARCTLQLPSGRASGFVELHVRSRVSVCALRCRPLLQAEATDRLERIAFAHFCAKFPHAWVCERPAQPTHVWHSHIHIWPPITDTAWNQTAIHHLVFAGILLVFVSTCFLYHRL